MEREKIKEMIAKGVKISNRIIIGVVSTMLFVVFLSVATFSGRILMAEPDIWYINPRMFIIAFYGYGAILFGYITYKTITTGFKVGGEDEAPKED